VVLIFCHAGALGRPLLFADYFFSLSDFFLNFAFKIFDVTFGFQIAIPEDLPDSLLELAFHLMQLALCVVLYARFHDIPPVRLRFESLLRVSSRLIQVLPLSPNGWSRNGMAARAAIDFGEPPKSGPARAEPPE